MTQSRFTHSFSLLQTFAICYVWCLVRSIAIPVALSLMRTWSGDPNYSSANCLLGLVNETEPIGFKNHILYGSIRFENSCDFEKYVHNQFNHEEITYLNGFFLLLAVSSVLLVLTDLKNVLSVKFVITFVAGYVLSILHHSYSHYGQDISFFVGNVMHHADTSRYVGESNATFVDTVPQGFTISIVLTVTWACIVRAVLPMFDPYLSKYISWKSLFFWNVVCGMIIAYKVKVWHPTFHQIATESMKDSLPFSYENNAYLHVFGHHKNGDWLGPNRVFDPMFSVFMKTYAYLHNEYFMIRVMTLEHYMFAAFFDSIVSIATVFVIWCVLTFAAASVDVVQRVATSNISFKKLA
jgi:hypothetical protein